MNSYKMESFVLTETGGKYFIWNDNAVHKLREEWKIVGALVGCLPSHPMQNLLSGLPAQLEKEEVYFVLKKGENVCKIKHETEFSSSGTSIIEDNNVFQLKSYFLDSGFFVTRGGKFGGDYLAYPGDPSRFHSFYVVILLEKGQILSALEMIRLGRLASHVKKSILLCFVDDVSHSVNIVTLQWTKIN